ncbi:unnamed protein product [Sphagnum compactum]
MQGGLGVSSLLLILITIFTSFAAFRCGGYGLALLDFKNGLESQGTALGNWRASDASPCNWEGVGCSQSGLVTSLVVANAGLAGPISPSLGKLEELQNLNLTQNMLSGSIPPELGNCSHLTTLALDNNQLTGSIPATLGKLQALQNLVLSTNELTGEIPSELANCTSLQSLVIPSNQLHGSVPRGIYNISNLRQLFIDSNNLTGDITEDLEYLAKLPNIEDIWMHNNSFSGTIPAGIKEASTLTTLLLNLQNNGSSSFGGLIPKELGLLPNLTDLDIRDNNFIGNIPPELGNISTLKLLLISSNKLTGPIPLELGNLTSLKYFHLYQNELTGHLPEELGNLHNLVEILAHSNNLTGTIPASLRALMGLTTFDVHNNSMSGTIPTQLFNCVSLMTLDLSSNEFTGEIPPQIGQLTNLTFLVLYTNQFWGPIPEQLEDLTFLQYLFMGINNFSGSIPMGLANLPNLLGISLSSNQLSGPLPSKLGMLSNLTTLDVTYNSFNGTLPTGLCQNGNLVLLDIEYNKFEGVIPVELTNCTSLVRVLNLSSNSFVGPIPPSLINCTKLFQLDLSHNFLNGSLPHAFPNALETLDLSCNQFSGTIPIELGKLQLLQILDLSHNQLSGTIPPTLGTQLISLQSVNVSYNDLTGSLPSSWIGFLKSNYNSFVGNPALCLVYSIDNKCTTNDLDGSKNILSVHIIVAIVVSCVVCVLGFILIFACLYSRAKSKNTPVAPTNVEIVTFPGSEISFTKVMEATQNLSDDYIIGTGGNATVYKAELNDGTTVAVKKIHLLEKDIQVHKSFLREINSIGNVKHRNLAKLLGFCKWGEIGLLLYDYIPNGDLFQALYNEDRGRFLDWDTRLKIAEGIAHGLAYLHHDCVPAIIHRDIKPSNVLLDANFKAHIADFGIAKVMALKPKEDYAGSTSIVEGTYGYIAPEFGYAPQVTPKVDIYSFGVVLLELLTGKRPVDPSFGESHHITSWVLSIIRQNCPTTNDELLDSRLLSMATELQKIQMIHVLKVAISCTKYAPLERLTMAEVVEALRITPFL